MFEPKYDGVRVLAAIDGDAIALATRLGHDRARQFPDVCAALARIGDSRRAAGLGPLVLDGELVVVPLAEGGGERTPAERARFQALQGRLQLEGAQQIAHAAQAHPASLVVFDCLLDGTDVLVSRPWRERRRRLEAALDAAPLPARRTVRLSDVAADAAEGRALLARMRQLGAEGVIAKRADAPYEPGRRSDRWRKIKVERRQDLVIGGVLPITTAAAGTDDVGALVVGYHDAQGRLTYAGKVGSGLTREQARSLGRRLADLRRDDSPFADAPDALPGVRWVEPLLVAEVKFNEWTDGGRLRQPVFLGLRDDIRPEDVRREVTSEAHPPKQPRQLQHSTTAPSRDLIADVRLQLRRIVRAGGSGVLRLANADGHGVPLAVTSLTKVLMPPGRRGKPVTKGALLEYYAAISPVLLPAIADRPLVLRRLPEGMSGEAFYQQHAPERVPEGVRVELVADGAGDRRRRRYIGGDLPTLLHLVQLGAVSVDPWHGRLAQDDRLELVDYSIIDLDPGPACSFTTVVQVARWVRQELDALGLHAVPKTSGATGLHVVVPLTPDSSAESARLLAELVATRVAERHPEAATIVRSVARRAADAVYVDYLQNIRGKTVASVYSARARPGATVSTPLRWTEVTARLDPAAFTIATVPRRIDRLGDLWAEAFRERNDLGRLAAAAVRAGRREPPARGGQPAAAAPHHARHRAAGGRAGRAGCLSIGAEGFRRDGPLRPNRFRPASCSTGSTSCAGPCARATTAPWRACSTAAKRTGRRATCARRRWHSRDCRQRACAHRWRSCGSRTCCGSSCAPASRCPAPASQRRFGPPRRTRSWSSSGRRGPRRAANRWRAGDAPAAGRLDGIRSAPDAPAAAERCRRPIDANPGRMVALCCPVTAKRLARIGSVLHSLASRSQRRGGDRRAPGAERHPVSSDHRARSGHERTPPERRKGH